MPVVAGEEGLAFALPPCTQIDVGDAGKTIGDHHRRTGRIIADFIVKGEGEIMVQPGQSTGEEIEILAGLKPGDILLKP